MEMTTSATKAKIVRVKIEADKSGLYFATSRDLKGLLVAERRREDLAQAIPNAISALYEAGGVPVIVTMAESVDGDESPWVAVPRDVVRNALSVAIRPA
jgi:hypothetical protein